MEVFVEHLHEVVNGLQIAQVVVVYVHADAEVQTRIASVDDLEVAELQRQKCDKRVIQKNIWTRSHLHKVGVLGIAHCDHGMHLLNQFLLLVVIEVHIPLGQASFSSSVLYKYESYLGEWKVK